jgi:hypothetical protein
LGIELAIWNAGSLIPVFGWSWYSGLEIAVNSKLTVPPVSVRGPEYGAPDLCIRSESSVTLRQTERAEQLAREGYEQSAGRLPRGGASSDHLFPSPVLLSSYFRVSFSHPSHALGALSLELALT